MLDSFAPTGERRPGLWAYHDIFDDLAETLSATEFKVFYVIYRETEGFSRDSWPLSETFLKKRANVKSVNTLMKVLLSLVNKGLITMWEAMHAGGTRFFALGDKLKAWLPLSKNDSGVSKNDRGKPKKAVIQRQLVQEEGKAEVIPYQKMTEGVSKNDRGGVKNYQGGVSFFDDQLPIAASPEAARQNAKESIKESIKEIDKESVVPRETDKNTEIEKGKEDKETYSPPPPEWSTVLSKIEGRVSVATFNTWIKPVEAHKQGDQFLLVVESSFHKEHLQRISREVRGILEPLLPPSTDIFVLTKKEYVLQASPAPVAARSSA